MSSTDPFCEIQTKSFLESVISVVHQADSGIEIYFVGVQRLFLFFDLDQFFSSMMNEMNISGPIEISLLFDHTHISANCLIKCFSYFQHQFSFNPVIPFKDIFVNQFFPKKKMSNKLKYDILRSNDAIILFFFRYNMSSTISKTRLFDGYTPAKNREIFNYY